ncbi:CYTH domain-containing protein [Bacillus pinisoli]|uniref:CYTH domain-containing protein n=1 Tax=Bacillus pinisoli TaxID=2901866 RepID=UPI001FF55096|nr:CYTH domain-containing protein [Bacillus pinisoli]
MTQELEIEFKNLVTKEEFSYLLAEFSLDMHQFIIQQNHYFDTIDFSLKERKAALRIRYKNNSYTLTLKQTIEEGILETHQKLTDKEARSILEGFPLIKGEVYDIIKEDGINPEALKYLGMLETSRAEIQYEDGTLVFDHSRYLNQSDYEIEYEATHFQKGQQNFRKFLQTYNIPIRETENKIRRFFRAKGLEGTE